MLHLQRAGSACRSRYLANGYVLSDITELYLLVFRGSFLGRSFFWPN